MTKDQKDDGPEGSHSPSEIGDYFLDLVVGGGFGTRVLAGRGRLSADEINPLEAGDPPQKP